MKNLLWAAGLGMVLAASAGAQAGDKIAVVNVASIYKQLPQSARAEKKLESEFKGRAGALQQKQSKLEAKMQLYQRDKNTLKASERSRQEKEIISEQAKFAKEMEKYQNDIRTSRSKENNAILKQIQDAVRDVARNKYDVVIDINALAYADESKDITADVLKRIK